MYTDFDGIGNTKIHLKVLLTSSCFFPYYIIFKNQWILSTMLPHGCLIHIFKRGPLSGSQAANGRSQLSTGSQRTDATLVVPEPSTEGDMSWMNVPDICVFTLANSSVWSTFSFIHFLFDRHMVGAQKIFVDKIHVFD